MYFIDGNPSINAYKLFYSMCYHEFEEVSILVNISAIRQTLYAERKMKDGVWQGDLRIAHKSKFALKL